MKLQCCHGNFSYSAKMASHECYLSDAILIANQMVYSWNKGIISLAFCPKSNNFPRQNDLILNKKRMKLLPNFTCHHLITHTYVLNKITPLLCFYGNFLLALKEPLLHFFTCTLYTLVIDQTKTWYSVEYTINNDKLFTATVLITKNFTHNFTYWY